MPICEKMEKAINAQINAEFYSAFLYLSMAAQCQTLRFKGLSNWFTIQYQEEVAHAMGFLNYLTERGGTVLLTAIDGPQTEWKGPVDMFETTCSHEAKVTAMINNLSSLAMETKDFAALQFFGWYVKEQVEEEATADEILGQLRMSEDNPSAMLMLDRELGARVFVAPVIG